MIYVVLGMHKSGTTLISQILHESGISMVEDPIGPMGYDAGQKFERRTVVNLNKAILNWREMSSLDVIAKSGAEATQLQRAEMRALIQTCDQQHINWGFKDPRTCLTYHSWVKELSSHRIVAIYRNYREVLQHYRLYGLASFSFSKAKKALSVWLHYNENLLEILHNTESPFVLLRYEDFMTDKLEFERLSRFVGHALKDSRNAHLYRYRAKDQTSLPFVIRKIANSLPRNPDDLMTQLHQLKEMNKVVADRVR